ncbi:monodechloroaminopyrrolnitrin synthase PrnB family protein [Micromonospora andamanensis]|uniref:monodechloroaminopyrrolnitrin synthase PrnB family protein n=1 Tax=Micromonospora andamanensis TaxID=1287068 RepID=UPI001950F7A1|nr:monodechloroaminopyrrolnitrin synthase PrnB family protein [Micromonospora andamanensis]
MHRRADVDVISEENNEQIRRLDPLRLDDDLRALPALNMAADVAALVRALGGALPSEASIAAFTTTECLAAMRDLGMYLGSLQRHGVSAFEAVPGAARSFQLLGRRTRMIPRDTVYHYTSWNPIGERERLYTGHPMERNLINAVRTCVPHLARAVDIGRSLLDEDPAAPTHADRLASLTSHIAVADTVMSGVRVTVAPEFFARVLRPFYEDVRVGGRAYMGPAAAHIPIFLIDLLLWASDRGSPDYLQFCAEVASQTLPQWQQRYAEWAGTPSVTSRVVAALEGPGTSSADEHVESSARSLRHALQTLTAFRGKHLVMARRAYQEELRLYELGSGGGSVGLLEEILALTRKNSAMLNATAGQRVQLP